MKYLFFLLSLSLLFAACQPKHSPLGPATDYFPEADLLRKGVVNKYYFHYTSADGYEKSTDIQYCAYRLLPDEHLEVTIYRAGYEPSVWNRTAFKEGYQLLEEQEQYWLMDTLPMTLNERQLLNWQGDTARLATTTIYGTGTEVNLTLTQTAVSDTLLEGKPAKVFYQQRERHFVYPEKEAKTYQATLKDTYRQGIGLYAREMKFEEGSVEMELVEQMPWKTFLKRRAAVPERVGYINPPSTMDNGLDLKICHPQAYIYDYYNGRPNAGYQGGKRALEEVFSNQLNRDLLQGVSGYLTFRFVINCEGEAGRFITEEADLNFKRIEFPTPLVQHVYQIISGLTDWQACGINDEIVDSYAYITLKIRDGQLIEILP